jgi:hypothetical protein
MGIYVVEIEIGDSFCRDGLISGNKDACFRTVMVGDGKDRVVSVRDREFDDEVHSYDFERLCIRVDRDGKKVWFKTMGIDFDCLTGGTSFDVFVDVSFHVGPPVIATQKSERVCDTRMSSTGGIVEKGNYPPLKIVVAHDNQGAILVPEAIDLRKVMMINPRKNLCLIHALHNLNVDVMIVHGHDVPNEYF